MLDILYTRVLANFDLEASCRNHNAVRRFGSDLCANMTETPSVTAISEQGGKEKTRHDDDKRHCSAGDNGSGRQTGLAPRRHYRRAPDIPAEPGGGGAGQTAQVHG
jgi:hypothetical protein